MPDRPVGPDCTERRRHAGDRALADLPDSPVATARPVSIWQR